MKKFRKYRMEMVMACLLLVSFYLLSRQAAVVSVQMNFPKLILIDPGHGEDDPGMIGVNGLEEKGIIQSMSRKGNCLDNSPMENFFGKMKNEMFYGYEYTFNTLEELKKEMENYISYYNNQRITTKLKGLTPVEYRNQSLITV